MVPAQWLSSSSTVSGRAGAILADVLSAASQPSRLRLLRRVLTVLFALWAVVALASLIWALVPSAEVPEAVPEVINPVSSGSASVGGEPVDIDRLVSWHLFGKPGATAQVIAAEPVQEVQDTSRDGIEKGARETRLSLTLRGIAASTDDGLGLAVIEAKKRQAVYAVGDKLPAPGRVELAKVMPRQVVLDNGGTYELLVLFEKSPIGESTPAKPVQAARPGPQDVETRADAATTDLARSYRDRLYEDPQSLAQVVNISPVRDGSSLAGYRVNPGKDREQFTQLGFKAGDLVRAINGVTLDNPANTMVLYSSLRSAQEAVFELERDGEALTLSVNLDSGAVE